MDATVLAFDFGLKRIGVAVGNTILKQGQPLTIVTAPDNTGKFASIADLIAEWKPALLVVGLPFYPDGAEHEMTKRCRRFANQLNGRFDIETVLVDERYSSAVLTSRRGEADDAQAAALILQQYFDDSFHNRT